MRTKMSAKEKGSLVEDAACACLNSLGYELLERNYLCRFGEIDIVARHNGVMVFVEVRYRGKTAFESPGESLTRRKTDRIRRAVRDYLFRRRVKEGTPVRVDACLASPSAETPAGEPNVRITMVPGLGLVRFEVIACAIDFG